MSKILVTGGAGFIGSHLVDELVDKGHTVGVVDYIPKISLHNNLSEIMDKIFYYAEDIRGYGIDTAIDDFKPDTIMHLAALINVDHSIQTPEPFWDINVNGTINLLESARKYNCKIIYMSTCEIYGNIPEGKADENHPTNPRSPYAASKFAAERYCMAYHHTYDLPVTIVRGFNIFGPRQTSGQKGAVIPIFTTNILGNKPIKIYGDGLQTRDYVYVKDIARGLAATIENDVNGEVINLATGTEHTILEIAYKLIDLCGKDIEPELIDARPGELRRSCGDATKAEKLLGWKPKTEFNEGLKKTMEWFKEKNG